MKITYIHNTQEFYILVNGQDVVLNKAQASNLHSELGWLLQDLEG